MTYDFTTLPQRWGTGAEKFSNMLRKDPNVPKDILPFSVADMDFLPPPELIQGLQEKLSSTIFGYTLPSESYYQTILQWMSARHGLTIPREWLVDADNVIAALRQMIYAYTKPTDGVILFTPVYPSFLFSLKATGRKTVPCALKLEGTRYEIDFEALEDLCAKPENTFLIFCNPHNPIGRLWSREELEQVAEICLRHNVFVVSDEIHWDLILPGRTFVSMASLPEKYLANCSISTAATKTFNMAAFKGAVMIMADPDRRAAYTALNGVSGRDLLSYSMCEIAYQRCEGWLDQLLPVLDNNRKLMADFLHDRLPEVGVIDLDATYLQWLDFRFLGLNGQELEDFMAFKARLFFTDGYKFGPGGEGFERWNIACPSHILLQGLERLEQAIRG